MIDEMKEDNDKEHKEISDRFEKLESKIEELSKFKWQIAGISALAIFLVGVIPTIKTLTPAPAPATIESTK
jgi:adenine-specific DNA methylase